MHSVEYTKAATKTLRRMPRELAERFTAAFRALAEDPQRKDLDVKPLQGRDGYRLRIGDWRAVYAIDKGRLVILVLAIGPRGDIYK